MELGEPGVINIPAGVDAHSERASDRTSGRQCHERADGTAMDYEAIFAERLSAVHAEGRYRVFAHLARQVGRYPVAAAHGPDGVRDVVIWCGNDYLAMGQHPVVLEAMHAALDRHGAGAVAVESGVHRLQHHRMLAHRQIVVAAPDHDVAHAVRAVRRGHRIAPHLPREVGEDAVSALGVHRGKPLGEDRFIVHGCSIRPLVALTATRPVARPLTMGVDTCRDINHPRLTQLHILCQTQHRGGRPPRERPRRRCGGMARCRGRSPSRGSGATRVDNRRPSRALLCGPVSYTHLTLPTNREV